VNLIPYVVLWAVMASGVIALLVWRKLVSSKEDDVLHVLEGESAAIPAQQEIARKLSTIDRWGKVLTAITFAYGVALAAAYVYQVWERSNQIVIR